MSSPKRALSYAHADAFFASVGAGKPPDCSFDSDHDYERCGNGAPVTSPVLFRRQPADAERVDVHDVRQGWAGDCALMATLAALASTPEGRALIENAIVENKNAQSDPKPVPFDELTKWFVAVDVGSVR